MNPAEMIHLTKTATSYINTHGSLSLRKCNAEEGRAFNDAVVIHGMLSDGSALQNFGRALAERNCHRNIWTFSVRRNRHSYVPKLLSKSTAEIIAESLVRNAEAGRLKLPLDIIGHSNGGYVAVHLTNILPAGYLRHVITLSTPSGVLKIDPDLDNVRSISHLVGAKDAVVKSISLVTGQLDARPTQSRSYFIFPDECHTSIHQDADSNGAADTIGYICGADSRHVFASHKNSSEQILHIFPWCRHEFHGEKIWHRRDLSDRTFTICDGMHAHGTEFTAPSLPEVIVTPWISLLSNIYNYWRVSRKLNQILLDTQAQLATALWENIVLKEEVAALNREIRLIEKKSKNFLEKASGKNKSIIKSLKTKKDFIISLVEESERIFDSKATLQEGDIKKIIRLLAAADKKYGDFVAEINATTYQMLPGTHTTMKKRG